jgi:hypothetical protein
MNTDELAAMAVQNTIGTAKLCGRAAAPDRHAQHRQNVTHV